MRNVVEIEDIEQRRLRAGIDDVELRSEIRGRIRSRVEGDKRTGTRPLKRGLSRLDGPNSGTCF
jgi:hypothetical protein